MKNERNEERKLVINSRRNFIEKGSALVVGSAMVGLSGMALSCNDQKASSEEREKEEEGEERVSANEDLMREHGLLQRMLLIYDTGMKRISHGEEFNPDYINQTADIVRNFVEEYHEKLEENYLFPRLEKANTLTALTRTLRKQHSAGRKVTHKILEITKNSKSLEEQDAKELIALMESFNIMYRPHEAREDTILFPAFKKVVSQNEYDSLGEEFEKKEHEKFGSDGFDMMVDKIATIEKQIGIYDLEKFTPSV